MPGEAQILFYSDLPDEGGLIEQTLRQVSGTEQVHVAIDEKAALTLLTNGKFDLVFARSKKGTLASTDFLTEVWKVNPRSTRFVLAEGAPDAEAMVRCALGAHQFIPTPLDPEVLSAALTRANSIKRFVKTERIQMLVSRMRTLPSRPTLYVELMRELRSKNASSTTVGELVSKDLAISTKLIQVANSAFFGLEQQVSEPAAAVLQLGLETTSALVLSIEAFARFDKVKPIYFSIDRVWKHSQTVADLARKICQAVGCDSEVSGQAYTAGLLHDIGKLAFAQNFEEDYQRTLKEAEIKNLPVYEVEQLVFGGTHADTGAYLLAVWGLPLPIVEAVADHHIPAAQLTAPLSARSVLHLAERLSTRPEQFEEIIAEYPPELGFTSFLEPLRAVIENGSGEAGATRSSASTSVVRTASKIKPSLRALKPKKNKAAFKWRGPVIYVSTAAVAVLIAIAFVYFHDSTHPAKALQTQPKRVEATPAQPKAEEKPTARPVVAAATPVEAEPAPKPVTLKLQAIMYNGEKSGLIINGTLLHQGDLIEGWKVISVTQRQAVVENNGQRQTLSLQ